MDPQKQLYDVIKGFNTAMLVSRTATGGIHARPMAVAELKPDADVYFATAIDSPKVAEVEANPDVVITFQGSSEFAALHGTVSVLRDRVLIEQLWSPAWKVWFPQGKDDPSICLIRFVGKEAEYWDNSGLKGLKYLYEGAKAVLKGERPDVDRDQHAKVKL